MPVWHPYSTVSGGVRSNYEKRIKRYVLMLCIYPRLECSRQKRSKYNAILPVYGSAKIQSQMELPDPTASEARADSLGNEQVQRVKKKARIGGTATARANEMF